MLHIKDAFLIVFVVFSLVLLADDSGNVREKIDEFAESIDKPGPIITSSTVTTSEVAGNNSAERYTKKAEGWRSKGDSQYGLALAAYEREDWTECLNRCLSARNNYERSIDNYELAVNEWEELKEESSNKVLEAFIDASINYYSCNANISETVILVCGSIESSCLAYSQGETNKGDEELKNFNQLSLTLETEEEKCDAILSNLVGSEEE